MAALNHYRHSEAFASKQLKGESQPFAPVEGRGRLGRPMLCLPQVCLSAGDPDLAFLARCPESEDSNDYCSYGGYGAADSHESGCISSVGEGVVAAVTGTI